MKRWLFLVLCLLPWLAHGEGEDAIPAIPRSRISDEARVFEQESFERFSRYLEKEYERYGISVYVVTVPEMREQAAFAYANRLQTAWIRDDLGIVLLYSESSNKISISLTKSAFRIASEHGNLTELAGQIDHFNEKGPRIGLPDAIKSLLDQLRVEQPEVAPVAPPAVDQGQFQTQVAYAVTGLVALFVVAVVGRKFFQYLSTHPIFQSSHPIRDFPVIRVLGSTTGGVNTVEKKF